MHHQQNLFRCESVFSGPMQKRWNMSEWRQQLLLSMRETLVGLHLYHTFIDYHHHHYHQYNHKNNNNNNNNNHNSCPW